jgi:hypothetical protein
VKPLLRFAAKLYPRAWRERYGAEFEVLLDDTGADPRIALNVFTEAIGMQVQRWKTIGWAGLLGAAALCLTSWPVGQNPYITPGTQLVFRQDSNLGAMVGLLVFLVSIVGGLVSSILRQDGRSRAGKRVGWASAGTIIVYLASVLLVSLLTPRTIVSIGDSYCYDIWCIGVQSLNATPQGQNILYTARVRIFSDANRVSTSRAMDFLYARDDRGRRFPLIQDSSVIPADVSINPGESVETSLMFHAPANVRKLYLTGDYAVMPWVPLFFGSDMSPLHRRTLLRLR